MNSRLFEFPKNHEPIVIYLFPRSWTGFHLPGNRNAIKGLGISIALVIFGQFTANFAITSYSVQIFQKSGSSFLDPHVSSIILCLTFIPGSLLPTYLADYLGRKVLNFISLMGSAIGLFAVSIYRYLKVNGYDLSGYDWVPLVGVSFVSLISNSGICVLSVICSVENLPSKVCVPGRNLHLVIIFITRGALF